MRMCEAVKGCQNKALYQVQFNDPWDFFFVCADHLGKSIHEEYEAQRPDYKEFIINRIKDAK